MLSVDKFYVFHVCFDTEYVAVRFQHIAVWQETWLILSSHAMLSNPGVKFKCSLPWLRHHYQRAAVLPSVLKHIQNKCQSLINRIIDNP